jgi:hypothetical protein
VVNDSFAGTNLVVTFDPESATGGTFSRNVAGRTLTFQPTDPSEYRESRNPLMVDDKTGSLWLMLTAEAVEGDLKGSRLEQIPSNYSLLVRMEGLVPIHPALPQRRSAFLTLVSQKAS